MKLNLEINVKLDETQLQILNEAVEHIVDEEVRRQLAFKRNEVLKRE